MTVAANKPEPPRPVNATYDYWCEKLTVSCSCLASAASIQRRLADAVLYGIGLIRHLDQVPEHSRDDFRTLIAATTGIDDPTDGSNIATCRALSDERCEELARMLPWLLFRAADQRP